MPYLWWWRCQARLPLLRGLPSGGQGNRPRGGTVSSKVSPPVASRIGTTRSMAFGQVRRPARCRHIQAEQGGLEWALVHLEPSPKPQESEAIREGLAHVSITRIAELAGLSVGPT